MSKKVQTATDRCIDGYEFVSSALMELGVIEPYCQYIVHIRTKFMEKEDWDYSNEILFYDEEHFHWYSDWDEGQPYVEVLGAVEVDDVVVPDLITEQEDSITENEYHPTHEQVEKIADSMQAWLEAFRADMIEDYKRKYGSDWEKHWQADKKESYEFIKQRQALFKPIIIPEQED